ncbi:thioredoxin [Pseudoscourfieldia marina]
MSAQLTARHSAQSRLISVRPRVRVLASSSRLHPLRPCSSSSLGVSRRSQSSVYLRSTSPPTRVLAAASSSASGSVVTQVDEPTWSAEIDAHDGPVLVYFWATWCGPCRLMAKIAEWAAGEFPSLKVVKVETDPNPTLTEKYDVYGLPTLYVFDKGEPVKEKWEGIITKDKLTEWLKERDALP